MIDELKFATQSAQFFIEDFLKRGDVAIDATCGNGNDTLFLAKQVGNNGWVFAIDIQKEAIENTKEALVKENLNNVTLIEGNHKNLLDLIPQDYHNKIKVVMFNLGYLPNSDHQIKTNKDTTLKAVEHALEILDDTGLITVCIYPHNEGKEEAQVLKDELKNLSGDYNVLEIKRLNRNNPPYLILITKG